MGDQVLVLLPIVGNLLQARYHGPYTIECCVNDMLKQEFCQKKKCEILVKTNIRSVIGISHYVNFTIG